MKILTYVILLLALTSCNNNPIRDENKEVSVTENFAEKNLKTQLNDYLVTLNGNNPENAMDYVYPDVFVYMKAKFPDDYSDEMMQEVLTSTMTKMKKLTTQKKVTYNLSVGDITSKISDGNSRIFIVLANVNVKKGLDTHTFGQRTVSISNDRGKNWKFMELDNEMAKPILKMKFSDEIVDAVMEK
jgi:hypothetical protein